MRLARADFVVWLIIFLVVAVSKVWSKFQEQVDDDSSRPPPKPKPPVAKRPLPRPRPLPQAQPMPRTASHRIPPPARPRAAEQWEPGGGGQLRDFMEQLQRKLQPQPVAVPPITPAAPAQPPAPPLTPKAKPQPASPAPHQPSRASQWAEALRDKQNIRNIVISAEIIGPPKAFQ
jgi:hypothetical protein